MSQHLCISIRFVQPFPVFHGRGDAGAPEWPPSPMRAFQALLSAAASRARGRPLAPEVRSALLTIESLRPEIIAPHAVFSPVGYRAYVPHNQTDLVTAAWHRGNTHASISEYRMEKDVRPMRIDSVSDDLPAVHYLHPLHVADGDSEALLATIRPLVRSIHCLGWGIDQVVADATLTDRNDAVLSTGERWRPASSGGRRLPVPMSGALDALALRYEKFLSRLVDNRWTPVPPLGASRKMRYRRDSDPVPRPYAVFKLLDENEDAFRYPHAKLVHIAGMVRHVANKAMTSERPTWIKQPADWVGRVVCGKRDATAGEEHQQFSYIPLPSIGHPHADAMIRNVMLVAPLGMERELNYVAERLDGEALQPEGNWESCEVESQPNVPRRVEVRRFAPPRGKFIDKCYLGTSPVWQSVTPVILDGHTKKSKTDSPADVARQTQKLICKALQRAHVETPCEFTWQAIPFLKNCLSAHKYDRLGRHTGYHRPRHLKDLTAIHVRLTFTHPVPGPIALGAGRHCGFGLMAAEWE